MNHLGLSRQQIMPLLKATADHWLQDNVLRLSAALAYYSVFSLAPLLVIAIGIAGWVLGPQAVSGELDSQLRGVMGKGAAEAVLSMLKSASSPSSGFWATVIGTMTLLLGATGVFGELKDALNTIWEVKQGASSGIAGFIRQRLLSFGMVLVIGFLLLSSLVFSTALAAAGKVLSDRFILSHIFMQVVSFLASAALVTALFAFIFKVLPDVTVQWRHVWVGAGVTAVLFELGKFLLGFYLGRQSTASSFGAAGSVVLVLLWVYYTSVILFTGAEFTQVYAKAAHAVIVPEAGAQPVTAEMRAQQGLAPEKSEVPEVSAMPEAPSGSLTKIDPPVT